MEEKRAHLGWGKGPEKEACELGLKIGILLADHSETCILGESWAVYCRSGDQVGMTSVGCREEIRLEGLPGCHSEGPSWVRRTLDLLELEGRH